MTELGEDLDPGLAWTREAGIPPEEVGMVTRLARINMLVGQLLDDLMEPLGVSVADSMVLASMRRGRTSPVELCRVLGRTTGGMSLTLDRLVKAGWVKRVPDPGDRRRIIVKLTAKGLKKAESVNAALYEWENALPTPRQEEDAIGAVLDRVALLVSMRAD